MKITKDMNIGEVIDLLPEARMLFASVGMHCLDCPHSRMESVEDACAVHGVDADVLIEQLNELSES